MKWGKVKWGKADVLQPWKPGAGDWNRAAATHLLRRAGFGPAPGEVERALAGAHDAAIDAVLAKDEHEPALHGGVRYLLPAGNDEQLAAWWMSLILAGGAPLRERVALMWHDHFATSNDKVDDVRLMHRQNELFREKGLGDFRELFHALATDPAMLVWLDGNENKRGRPNENFAREVMELFGLGIGNYTEKDIQEAARAFTGWGTKGRSFVVRENEHDLGTKTIFGKRGAFRGEDVIELIIEHPACRRHVARRLLEELVAPAPEEAWIEETAAVLVASDWSIGRTIERILRSKLFFGPAARRSRIAGPVELVAMTVCALGARVAPSKAAEAASEMGQSLFRPPSVKGWDGGRTWINAGTWLARHNALVGVAQAHIDGDGDVEVDLRESIGDPSSIDAVPGLVLAALLPDVDELRYVEKLRACAESCSSVDEALAMTTAVALTSPEYHLV
ncbi:MAG: DUF1800 domain-containing protein [Planctomycetota bacterium]|nr:DUF1800 domain-containing protein [Planctomycetota bacterium]